MDESGTWPFSPSKIHYGAYCEGLKRDASAPLYGYYLAHKDNQQPDVVRHFGLGLIENVVRYRWSDGTLTPETKAQIRDNVMSLAAEGSKPLLTEQSFIKEKVARLFVEVAKREWPGVWENMDAFLRQLFFKDETGREMALLILRSLCEDVFVYDDAVAGLRKKDLRAGLLVIMSSEGVLKEHYPDGVKGHRDEVTLMLGESGNDGWIARLAVLLQELLPRCQSETRAPADEKIAIAALKTFSSGLDWVIFRIISTGSSICLPIITVAIGKDSVGYSNASKFILTRQAGAECYDVLSCRNLSDAEREKIIWPLLEEGGVDIISRAYLAYATQILQGEAYKFIQKTVQATVNLGEQQLCAKRSAYVPKELSKWETDLVYRHFASIDFDSVTEFRGYAEKTFARAVDVIHRGVPVVPLDAFIWVGNKVTQALQTEFPQATDVRETSQYHQFDGTLTLMEITISSLKDLIADSSHAQAGQVLDAVNSLLGILIEYDNKCLPAVERCVATFSAFTDLFKLNSTLLFRSLDKLFKTVEHPMSDLTMRDARQLRLRAATTLAKIGKAIPNTLYPIYGQIEIAIQGLIQRNAITHGEKRTLQLFLLVIGFNSNMPLDRKTIFENIVQPVVLDLHSPDVQEALSDPKKFMAFIGVSELSNASITTPLPEQIDALKRIITQRRCKLSGAIESLHAFMKETIDVNDDQRLMLWTSRIDSILPGLFSTIRCLSAICDERLWADFSPDVSRALSLSAEEKEMMVTGKAPSAAAGSAPTGTVARLIFDLKNWLSSLRDQSYRVLAQISQLGPAFYSISSLQTILEQSLFGHVDYLTDRQLRLLINHAIQPLVLNCPESSMDSVLSHLLTVLFPYLDQRLLKDWKLASDEGLVMDEKDDPEELDITDGIVREVMLRDLTFYIAGFIFSILDYAKKAPVNAVTAQNQGAVGAAGHKEIAPLALFILSRDTIVQSIIPLMCHIMTFKDTKSCLRSTEAALCVLTVLVQNYPGSKNIIGSFSTTVLQSAMEALHDPYHQEGHDKLIRLITEVYVEVRAFDEAPKLVFQQTLGADTQRLEAFERDLSAATNKTEKHALVRNFLQGIIGVAKSEWFKQKEQDDKPVSSRTITGKYERPSQSVLDSKDHEDIGEGLASLFDE
ncbi:hypothetical protein BGZ54_000832 [Gamsiella multidivaricata]|nr:hypothetical protein BGZ54_000832 [Gamsiella multidivaricata]